MKILFIDPPLFAFYKQKKSYFAYGLCSMATLLRREGFDAWVFDPDHRPGVKAMSFKGITDGFPVYLEHVDSRHPVWEEVSRVLKELKPNVIGISTLPVKYNSVQRTISIIKEFCPEAIIVVGGRHATSDPELYLKNQNVTLVVRGEGELPLLSLCKRLSEQGKNVDLKGIGGLSYRQGGRVLHSKKMDTISNLDTIPYPDRGTLLRLQNYTPSDLGMIMASRGCPYSCTFCAVNQLWGSQVNRRSVSNVVDEIEEVNKRYRTRFFGFRDSVFTLSKTFTEKFCRELIGRNLRIAWECLTRLDCLNKDLLVLMKKAGCKLVRIGIESGSPRILSDMGKKIDLDQIRSMACLLHDLEFYWSAYFLFGTPNETEKDIRMTLSLIREIDPPFITASTYEPVPGTRMYNQACQQGLIENQDVIKSNRQSIQNCFSANIPPARFKELMAEVAGFVDYHNRKNRIYQLRIGSVEP